MRVNKLLPLIILCLSLPLFASEITREFESDYCTFLPIKNPEVSKCCYTHDLYYWTGGSKKDRKDVDHQFKKCIENEDKAILAAIMYAGVKLGSMSPWKFKGKQWGNAWGDKVRKKELTNLEIKNAHQSLTKAGVLAPDQIENFINSLRDRVKDLK